MIELNELTISYGELTAIENVSLQIDQGEFVTVIGPSGCGKSTLLRTIGGLQEPTTGIVRVDGEPPSVAQKAAAIGFVFQDNALFPWKNALENITFLRRMANKPPDTEGARDLLERVGLGEFIDAHPTELSGGMKQRVAIARTLHLGAEVLLMDEPFGELDELTRDEMSVEVRRLWRETSKTVVFITHSVPEAVLLGDRCVVMHGTPGHIVKRLDIDLPRPRTGAVFSDERFQRTVANIRSVLHDGDEYGGFG